MTSRIQNQVKIIILNGQLDANNVGNFRESFLTEVDSNQKVIIDCTGLQYLDSSGLATLLNLHKNLSTRDASLVLCGLSEGILRVIRFTKLDKVLDIKGTVDEGIQGLTSP